MPGCVHASIADFLEDEKSKRITFFYGSLSWQQNEALYEQVCERLAVVCNKKLNMDVAKSDFATSTSEKGEGTLQLLVLFNMIVIGFFIFLLSLLLKLQQKKLSINFGMKMNVKIGSKLDRRRKRKFILYNYMLNLETSYQIASG